MTDEKHPSPNEWYKLGPFTIFDVETTGMSPALHRIVEIAAVRIAKDGALSKFHSLINPGCKIPSRLTAVHGITDEMVESAEFFSDVGGKFLLFATDSTLVAHNAKFDLGFLQESLSREFLSLWNGKTLDTIPIIKRAYPGLPSYALQNLRYSLSLGSGDEEAHRAFADVELTLEAFSMAMKRLLAV